MRKKLGKLVCTFIFCNAALFADQFVGEMIDEELDVIYSYYQNEWTMELSDGSTWKLMPQKEKRKQTWTEWFYQTEPKEWQLSDDFFFDPRDWRGRYTVEVHMAKDSLFSGYDYVIVNENNDQKVFAKFIPNGADFVPKIEYAQKIKNICEAVSTSVLSSYSFLDDVLTLDDKSIWKLHFVGTNSRTLSEWWNDVVIDQPDAPFISKLGDWKPSDKVEIYHAYFDNSELNEKYRVAKPDQEVFLLENKTRQKMAYASEMAFKDLLDGLQKHGEDQYQKGVSKGYSEGYNKGYKDGQAKGQSDGYKEGHSKGFSDGFEKGKRENQPRGGSQQ